MGQLQDRAWREWQNEAARDLLDECEGCGVLNDDMLEPGESRELLGFCRECRAARRSGKPCAQCGHGPEHEGHGAPNYDHPFRVEGV